MKFSIPRIFTMALAIALFGGALFLFSYPNVVPAPVKARLPGDSGLASFEFMGCSGTWPLEEATPQVWLINRSRKPTLLVRHPDTCGYTAAERPRAWIASGHIQLYHEPISENGTLAACFCEYWTTFTMDSLQEKVVRITLNGRDAKLMGHLANRR